MKTQVFPQSMNTLIQKLSPQLVKYVQMAGCLYLFKDKNSKQSFPNHVPFAAFPYQMNKNHYESLQQTQKIWAKLFVKIAGDKKFINETLANAAKNDDFVKRLLSIFNEVKNPQKVQMIILRNDYMMDEKRNKFLMVEYNLMSVGMLCVSDKVQDIQKEVLPRYLPDIYQAGGFPAFNSQNTICDSIIESIDLAGLKGKIVMIVPPEESNIYDQGFIQQGILKRKNDIIRCTFSQLFEKLKLNDDTLDIFYDEQIISVFYFRQGYVPSSYTKEDSWNVRQIIQRSRAIKIPTVAMQLVNTKRIQQQLFSTEVLSRYLTEEESFKIYNEMAAMYNFDNKETFQTIIKEMDSSQIIVKPNREGGNNNIFAQEALKHLKRLTQEERQQYILMQKICSKGVENIFFKQGELIKEKRTVSEISMSSVFIHQENQLVKFCLSGGLIRSKNIEMKEGGVSAQASFVTGLYVTQ